MQSLTWFEITVGLFSIIAAIAAVISGIYSYSGNIRSKRIEKTLKSDEYIVHGKPAHPELNDHAHSDAIINCRLVNKAKHRRAYVRNVRVFDRQNNLMETTWCSSINHVGNPQDPGQAIPIDDSSDLFIRRNDGEGISYAKIEVFHSFPRSPAVITYDATSELFGDDMPD